MKRPLIVSDVACSPIPVKHLTFLNQRHQLSKKIEPTNAHQHEQDDLWIFYCIILRTRLCSPSATNMQVSYLLTISREIIYVVKPTDSACSVFIRVCTPTYRHVITFSVEAFFYSANISRFHSILIYFSIIVVVVYCDFLYIHTYIFTCLSILFRTIIFIDLFGDNCFDGHENSYYFLTLH